jgi:hypothetical protein
VLMLKWKKIIVPDYMETTRQSFRPLVAS